MTSNHGLHPRLPPYWLARMIAECCRSRAELRALLRQDLAFQQLVLEGRDPAWVFRNWRVKDRVLRTQRVSWLLTGLLTRHVAARGYFLLPFIVLPTMWLAARVYRQFKRVLGSRMKGTS